tara:strand:- start:1161 stop:1313 length:153 start_codon:yes stop_codon:yes gene_type:complete
MKANSQLENEIKDAILFFRENNMPIPSEILELVKDSSIETLIEGMMSTRD